MVLAIAGILQWIPSALQLLNPFENAVKDQLIHWSAGNSPETRLVVVDINEESLQVVGPWPWTRDTIADLSERLLGTYQAKGVGLDIVFPAPADTLGDQRLAALAENAPLTLAQVFDYVHRDPPVTSGQPVIQAKPMPGSAPSWLTAGRGARATGYLANHSGLAHAPCVGNIGIQPDPDGQIRKIPWATHWQAGHSWVLPMAMLMCGQLTTLQSESLLQLLQQPYWRIAYPRHFQAYTVVSARDVLTGQVPKDHLQHKWILVGSSALGLNDRASSPLASSIAGVMVHASVMTSLLDQIEQPVRPSVLTGNIVAFLCSLSIVLGGSWFILRHRAWLMLPLAGFSVALWLWLASGLLRQQLDFAVIPPLVAVLLLFVLAPLEWWLTQRDQNLLLQTFSRYVAPSVLRQMLAVGVSQPLEAKRCHITVLSADMENYSGLTLAGSLQDAAELTREFLDCITQPVLSHQGTLDKYTGDGLVAFWGAPLPMSDHSTKALGAALQITHDVARWNQKRARQGKPMARVRIGIEAGIALVGDLGTPFRRTYTAVGDCINSASKIQSTARHYNHDILVGPKAVALNPHRKWIEVTSLQLPKHTSPAILHAPAEAVLSCPPFSQAVVKVPASD